jgi:polyferredoxin
VPDPAEIIECEDPIITGADGGILHEGHTLAQADDGSLVMVMTGIPGWMFGLSIGLVVLLSFGVVEKWRPRFFEGWRFNLTRRPSVHRLLRKPWFQFAFAAPVTAIFLFTIYAGLFGSFARNITPILVWTVWWAGLVFAVALLGNAFCFVCPWDLLANIATRLAFWRRKPSLSMGWKWPAALKTVYPAIVLFVGLTWLELGFGVTNNPRQTAYLGMGMAALAISMALVFEKKAFCRSLCLVGRVSGMYANAAPVEIRTRDPRVCGVCKTRDCLVGNELGHACPTGIDLGKTLDNSYCTQCTECFKSCPTLAPAVNLRPFGEGLSRTAHVRLDEAWLAIALLTLTAFHGLSMTPAWESFRPGQQGLVDWLRGTMEMGRLSAFSLGMLVVCALPVLAYGAATLASYALVRGATIKALEGPRTVSLRDVFIRNAMGVLPVALFYHLAHNALHILAEGLDLIPMLSDPLGRGWDLFGTATWHMGPVVSQETTWVIQVVLVIFGHLMGVLVSHRIARDAFPAQRDAIRSLLPFLALMVLLSVGGLWLMHLDMNMRVGRM